MYNISFIEYYITADGPKNILFCNSSIQASLQIQRITNEIRELIDRVTNHTVKVTNQVEEIHNKLMLKKDRLRKIQSEVDRLVKDGHVTEKIMKKKRIAKEMEKCKTETLHDPKLADPPTLINTGDLYLTIFHNEIISVNYSVI